MEIENYKKLTCPNCGAKWFNLSGEDYGYNCDLCKHTIYYDGKFYKNFKHQLRLDIVLSKFKSTIWDFGLWYGWEDGFSLIRYIDNEFRLLGQHMNYVVITIDTVECIIKDIEANI